MSLTIWDGLSPNRKRIDDYIAPDDRDWDAMTKALIATQIEVVSLGGSSPTTTDDLPEGVNNLYYTNARADARITLQKGQVNGLATLGSDGLVPTNQLPNITITDTFVVASEAAMLALTAQTGDIAIRTDLNKTFILKINDPTILANWQELLTPTDSVTSVNGETGVVTLDSGDIPEGTNLYYTDERVDDRVGALLIDSASVDFTYNDGANTLTAVVIANTTNQQINVSKAGTSVGTRKQLNFIEGSNISLTIADNTGSDRVDITVTNTAAASPTTTDGLPEGSTNLYYTNERVDDRVAALIQNGTGISWTYDDSSNTLIGNVSITQYTDEMVDDRVATLIQNGTGLTWTYVDASNILTGNVSLAPFTTSNLAEGSNLYYTDERVDDRVGALLIDSASVDFTYNDGANTLTAVVIANTTNQKVNVSKAGTSVGTRKQLNFIEGSNVTLTIADNSGSDRIDITVAASGGSGAPTDATYITQTANGTLSAEQALGSLISGLLVNTTTTGVLTVPKITAGTNGALRTTGTGYGATTGDTRGTGAVDLQTLRTVATQVASGNYSIISGGIKNTASGLYSTVSGGNSNIIAGNGSNIAGGGNNTTNSSTYSAIGGGRYNSINITGFGDKQGTIAGGKTNSVTAKWGTVGGGNLNTASGQSAIIGGGEQNTASAIQSTIAGGFYNTASGNASTVGGGYDNLASAEASSISGGYDALANKFGQQSHASGKFAARGDAQKSEFILRNITTNATQTELFLNGSSAQMVLANDTTWTFSALIVARRTDVDNESAAFKIEGCIDRQTNAASTAIVITTTQTVLARDNAAWDAILNADTTNGSLRVLVTGEASKTIRWVAFVQTVETTG